MKKMYPGKKPGMQKLIARSFKGQPPLVPHATDNFDGITVTETQCLDCHGQENYKEKSFRSFLAANSYVGNMPVGKQRRSFLVKHVSDR